jgi:hypothetical protein
LLVGFHGNKSSLEDRERNISTAQEKLKKILTSLREFSEASRELEAWKTVHHITNKLETDLTDTMRLVAAGRIPFIGSCDERDRKDIASELRSMYLRGGSLAELQVFRNDEQLFVHVREVRGVKLNDETWDEMLLTTSRACQVAIEEGNTGVFYDKMERIKELALFLNNTADYKLKEEVEHNYQVMKQLEQKIREIEP